MTETNLRDIAIAGASGSLGIAIVQELLASKKFKLFALARPESKTQIPAGVQVIKTDFSPASLAKIFDSNKFDSIITSLNVLDPAGCEAEINLVEAASASGVKRFIPSGFGANSSDSRVLQHVPAWKAKYDIVERLKKLESGGMSWTSVACGAFFDWGFTTHHKFANADFSVREFTLYDEGTARFHATNMPTIGKAIVSLLSDPARLEATANRYVYISSYTLTQSEMFNIVEKVWAETGRPGSWTRRSVSSVEAAKRAGEQVAAGDFAGIVEEIKIAFYGAPETAYFPDKLDNELLGLPIEDVEADTKRILDLVAPIN